MERLKEMHNIIFKEDWPMWAGGILLAILSILMWMGGEPWAMIGGYRNWGDWFLTGIGVYEGKEILSPLIDTKSIMALGVVFGAFTASLIAGGFGFRMPPWWELLKGLVGGALMGFSAVMAGGCNVGGFYSQFAALSLSGIFMWAGLIIGAILGLRYIKWEIEHIPSKVLSAGISLPSAPSALKKSLPYLGWIFLVLIFFMPIFYGEDTKLGILATVSLLAGFVMMRSRFCFAATFRDPFMTGESDKTQAVILSILILVLGVSIVKWSGIVPSYKYVFSNAGWGGVVGGAIFGFGMLLAGGCGSGTLFRVGEGQIKLMGTMVTMAISNSLTRAWLWPKLAAGELSFGKAVYLPESVGWLWTFIIIFGVMLVWYLFILWNEDTNKCVVM